MTSHANGVLVAELRALSDWVAQHESAVRRTGRWTAVIQLLPRHGDESVYVEIDETGLKWSTGQHPQPSTVIEAESGALASAIRGDVDITQIMARGQGTVSGDYYAALNLSRLALARRRQRT